MKKLLSLLLVVVALFGLAACGSDKAELAVVGRSQILVDEEIELQALLVPATDEELEVTWKSSKPAVATVEAKTEGEGDEEVILSEFGVVKGVAVGETTITVKAGGATQKFVINVVAELVEATGLTITGGREAMLIGDAGQLVATVAPANADQQVTWVSVDEYDGSMQHVVSVDAFGRFEAKSAGVTIIRAVSVANDEILAELEVEVKAHVELAGEIEGLPTETTELELTINDPDNLQTTATWKTSNPAVATVNENGVVTRVAPGKAVITAEVKALKGRDVKTATFPINVLTNLTADQLAGGADGMTVSFKYADSAVKAEILAAMERWLINKGASIPFMNNAGAAVYSDRVTLPTDAFVPLMGWGALYGELTQNDPATGTPYRNFTTADPKTLNHLQYADSVESDIMTLTELSLFSIEFNEEFNGYVMVANAASKLAEPVEWDEELEEWVVIEDFDVQADTAQAWKITIREDLNWVKTDGTVKRAITLEDFMYSYRMALDPVQANRRANLFYSSSGIPIKGAAAYFNQRVNPEDEKNIPATGNATGDYATVPYSEVGIHPIAADNAFVVELTTGYQQWDIHYNMGSFVFAPVFPELFEAGFDAARKTTNYGSAVDKYMSSGAYILTYWENQKEIRYVKNTHFVENDGVQPYTPNRITTAIVRDANAAIELFENGDLDVVTIPATHFDQYKNHEGLKKSPGATAFRFSVNRLTQAEQDVLFGVGSWETKPILQENDFMWALYFGINRAHIATEIGKTTAPEQFYFTQAYVVDPLSGQAYRDTAEGSAVATGIFEGDINLGTSTLGYNAALARNYYVKALDSMIEKGVITEGTSRKPVVIQIELANFDSVTQKNINEYIVQSLEENFNGQTKYPNIRLDMVSAPQPGMDVYYEKQMKGRYDLAIAGISGGLLDPVGLLETFIDDNRSGLMLSLGLDTHSPSILLNLDIDGDGTRDGAKYWSFDALYVASAGEAFIKMGVEAIAPTA